MFHIFLVCSGLAALVNLGVGFILYRGFGLDSPWQYAFSVGVAFLAGMGVSFVLNRRFTYQPSGRAVGQELRDFGIVSLGGLALTTGLAVLLATQGAGMIRAVAGAVVPVETAAHLVAVGVTAIYSFLAHKHVSFRRARQSGARI